MVLRYITESTTFCKLAFVGKKDDEFSKILCNALKDISPDNGGGKTECALHTLHEPKEIQNTILNQEHE